MRVNCRGGVSGGWVKRGSSRWVQHPSPSRTCLDSALAEGLGVQVMKNPSLGLSSIGIAIFPASSGLCLCSSLWIVGFFVGLGHLFLCFVVCALRESLPFSGLAPSMYLWPAAFSGVECPPVTTPLWSLILDPCWLSCWKGCWVFCTRRGATAGWVCY